jgi:hypothetical protein
MQVEQAKPEVIVEGGPHEISTEIFSRLMTIGSSKSSRVSDQVEALEAAWRVYADFIRLINGD